MQIWLNEIPYYYLSILPQTIRQKKIESEFKEYNPQVSFAPTDTNKARSGAAGLIKILDLAVKKQDTQKRFQPFVIWEDDVSTCHPFPQTIELPDDADVLYIGACIHSYSRDVSGSWLQNETYAKKIDTHVMQVFNMLSTHGLLFTSLRGVLAYTNAVIEAGTQSLYYDWAFASIHRYYKVYALTHLLVYQTAALGGLEDIALTSFDRWRDLVFAPEATTISKHYIAPPA